MSRIAFAWEMGNNPGQIEKILPIAEQLDNQGHEITLIVRDLNASVIKSPWRVLQAPLWLLETKGLPEPPLNYSEMLLHFGYHNYLTLLPLVNGWQELFKLCKTDIVVASHAPTALLTAKVMDLPSVALSHGFSLPPMVDPMPNMRPWLNVPLERLKSSDEFLLKSVNQVLAIFGKEPISKVSSLMEVNKRFICSYPELDYYLDRKDERFFGPITMSGEATVSSRFKKDSKTVFVYLKSDHKDFSHILDMLNLMGLNALVCAPNISQNLKKKYASKSVIISEKKFDIDVLKRCDLAVTYGGHGMVSSLLKYKVPMLVLPTNLEQFLLGLRVQELGAGIVVNSDVPVPSYEPVLQKLLSEPIFKDNIARFADSHSAYDQSEQIKIIAAEIAELKKGKH